MVGQPAPTRFATAKQCAHRGLHGTNDLVFKRVLELRAEQEGAEADRTNAKTAPNKELNKNNSGLNGGGLTGKTFRSNHLAKQPLDPT